MSMTSGARELEAASLRRTHPLETLGFSSTEEVHPVEGPVGEDRAAEAIAFGLETRMAGYKIFATGTVGVGKRTALVRVGRFHVWSARTVEEGIALLTGIPAGQRGPDGQFPDGTLHARVEERLERWARMAEEQNIAAG